MFRRVISLFKCLKDLVYKEAATDKSAANNNSNNKKIEEKEEEKETKHENDDDSQKTGVMIIIQEDNGGDLKMKKLSTSIIKSDGLQRIYDSISEHFDFVKLRDDKSMIFKDSEKFADYVEKCKQMTEEVLKQKLLKDTNPIQGDDGLSFLINLLPKLNGQQLFEVWTTCDLLAKNKYNLKLEFVNNHNIYTSTSMNGILQKQISVQLPTQHTKTKINIYFDEKEFNELYKMTEKRELLKPTDDATYYEGIVIRTGEKVIIKEIKDTTDTARTQSIYAKELELIPKRVARAIDIMQEFADCASIQKIESILQSGDQYLLVGEFYDFTLDEFMNKYKGNDCGLNVFITHQLLGIVKEIHSKKQTNREINAQNIGINIKKQQFLLINTGSFRQKEDASHITSGWLLNEPVSQAPEQFGNRLCDEKVDIWSAGILSLSLVTDVVDLYQEIMNDTSHFVDINGHKYCFGNTAELKRQLFYSLISDISYYGKPKYEDMAKQNQVLLRIIGEEMLKYKREDRKSASQILEHQVFRSKYPSMMNDSFNSMKDIFNADIIKEEKIKKEEETIKDLKRETKKSVLRKRKLDEIDCDNNNNVPFPPNKKQRLK